MENNKPQNEMENTPEKKKSKKRLVILGGVFGTGLLIAIIYFIISAGYVSTDNAQLDADIVPIRSSVSGYVKTIHFKDNDRVKKGQLLITIDDTDLKTKVAQAEAALENAKAALLSVKSNAVAVSQNADASSLSSASVQQNITSAKAKLTRSQADYKRVENMFASKAATQSQLDAAKADLDISSAQYEAAVNQYKSAAAQSQGVRSQAEAQKAQITLAEAMVKQREAELALAQTQLDNATIEAPCDGIVTKRAVEEGQYISIGQPMCSTIDKTHLWVTANFKETQMNKLHPGEEVDIRIDAYPDMKISGTVGSFIGATGAKFSLLPPDNSTGNFVKIIQRVPVRIELTEYPKDQSDELFPGLSAFVEVKVN
jgi:membrane fusion protein (multidrug efflux system)